MGCIRVDKITEYLCEPLRKCLKDEDPYVRKTAAVCVAKLHDINASLVEDQGFLDQLKGESPTIDCVSNVGKMPFEPDKIMFGLGSLNGGLRYSRHGLQVSCGFLIGLVTMARRAAQRLEPDGGGQRGGGAV